MGASYFQTYGEGTNTKQVFTALVAEAKLKYGQKYTGSIAEKDGFVLRKTPKQLTMAEARKFAQADGEDADKSEDAYAVPVYDESQPPRQVGVLFYGWARD